MPRTENRHGLGVQPIHIVARGVWLVVELLVSSAFDRDATGTNAYVEEGWAGVLQSPSIIYEAQADLWLRAT